MKKYSSLILAFLLTITAVNAQVLSVEEAINTALKNNYDILVARNDADAAKVNNTLGNAGMLPTISATAGDNFSLNNLDVKPFVGNEIKANNAGTNALNAAAGLSWTLFDGGKMFITKKKLTQLQALGELQFKDKVMQTVNDVVLAYYDVVNQKRQLLSLQEVITYNQERVKIFETRFNAGLSPKTDMLQAKLDLNVNKENVVAQQVLIINSKRKLNQLLSREVDAVFDVPDAIPLTYSPNKSELMQKLLSSNTSILSSEKQIDIAKLSIGEFKSLYLPKLTANASYNFIQNNNKAGSTLFSRTFGPQFGGTLSIPLYQGGNVKRQVEVAKIQLKSAEYTLEKTKLIANTQLQNALTDFENQQALLKIEQENTGIAKENLDISLARLKQGQTNSLELHLAETSYQSALARLSAFEYNVKVAETKLRQLIAAL